MVQRYPNRLMALFPGRELEILRLCSDDELLRSICEEMEMAATAERRWRDVPERAQEYRQILERLEEEFTAHLARRSGDPS